MVFSTLTIVSIPLRVIASVDSILSNQQLETLQIEITPQDIKNIDNLVTVAEGNSPQIREAKAAIGLSTFNDVMSISLSASRDNSSSEEYYISLTINPIRLLTATQQSSVVEARWLEEKRQKRVAVVQYYVEYLQARQASKVAAYQMQKFASDSRIASVDTQNQPQKAINHIGNADYVAAAKEMLNTNTRERVTLEQLAASVGLSPKATTTIINQP
ncbi:hypothetical protein L6494_14575 [Nostoc sp. UHCC 0870]|nr:hypothetical protein L6494_14575 [Nostoc sp. UHCC 0870]